MLKTVALVPCRGGSKRVVDKNGRMLGEKPLYWWSIETAVKLLGMPCYVSTEVVKWGRDSEFLKATWIKRPEELAGDETTDYEVIRHALGKMPDIDLLLYLRPTTPFRDPAVVREAIEIMENEHYTSLRSVELMVESAYKCFTMEPSDGLLAPFLMPWGKDLTDCPNQELTPTYKANGYIDIIRPGKIDGSRWWDLWGYRKYGFVTPRTVEIDTEEDLEYARWYYENKWNKEGH